MSDSNDASFDIAPFDFDSLMDSQKAATIDSHKAFPCADCGKVFHHSCSLSRHRIQKHFKPYVCQLCEAHMENPDDFRSHLNAVHGFAKPVTCRCCEWIFADLASVNVHNKSIKETGVHAEDVKVLAKPANTDGNANDAKSKPRPAGPPAKRRKVSKPSAKRTKTDEVPVSATTPNPVGPGVLNKLATALMRAQNSETTDHVTNVKKELSAPCEVNNNESVFKNENLDPFAANVPKAAASMKVNKRKAFMPMQIKVEDSAESEEPLPKKHASQAVEQAVIAAQPVKIEAEANTDCESSSTQKPLSEAKMQALLAAQLDPSRRLA
ncbi:HAM-2 protein [Aphelenchoides avenae]|nr:HAM-2 protein [Aphelenchus avenae]